MCTENWELKNENSTHYIYKCPHCPPDKVRPTLYLDKRSGKFLCFRCGYSGIDSKFLLINEYLKQDKPTKKPESSRFDLSLIQPLSVDSIQYKYLLSRGLSREEIIRYDFKVYDKLFKTNAVFIHNGIENNITDYYQLRFINPSNPDFRYYNAKVDNKPLFGRQGLMGNSKLMLCEGIFTAIAASRLGVDTLCLLGKTLTDYQSTQLKEIVDRGKYEEIIVGLDYNTCDETKQLSSYLLSTYDTKISTVILKTDVDYADQDLDEMNENFNNRLLITTSNLDMWEYLCKI